MTTEQRLHSALYPFDPAVRRPKQTHDLFGVLV